MNTTLIKGILKYIGIIFAILFAICILLFAIMFFDQNFKLFGYKFIRKNSQSEISEVQIQGTSLENSNLDLIINATHFNIEIKGDKTITDLQYMFINKQVGFTNSNYSTNILQRLEGERLVITLIEKIGLLDSKDSMLKITVPTLVLDAINLTVKNDSGLISISNMKINSLNIDTNGNLLINNIKGIESESDEMTIFESLKINSNHGKYDFSKINKLKIIEGLVLYGKGQFTFKNLYASVCARGHDLSINAETIETSDVGFEILSQNGAINVNKLISLNPNAQNVIFTENSNVFINELFGDTNICCVYGNVKIETTNNKTIISNDEGNVTVNDAKENISITTVMGDIKVKNYNKSGTFSSQRGNITVKNSSLKDNFVTTIISKDGKVKLDNLENKVVVNASGKSQLELIFRHNLPNQSVNHVIILSSSTIADIYISQNDFFKLRANGKVSGNIGTFVVYPTNTYVNFPLGSDDNAVDNWYTYDISGGTCSFYTLE